MDLVIEKGIDHNEREEIEQLRHRLDKEFASSFFTDLDRAYKSDEIYVAKLGEEIVGFLIYGMCSFDNEVFSVDQLYVAAEHQSTGIGKALLAKLECSFQNKVDTLMLSTKIPEYYQKLGWVIIPTHRKEWHLMSKSIAERW